MDEVLESLALITSTSVRDRVLLHHRPIVTRSDELWYLVKPTINSLSKINGHFVLLTTLRGLPTGGTLKNGSLLLAL